MEKTASGGLGGSGLWEIVDAAQEGEGEGSDLLSMQSIEQVDSDPDSGEGRIMGHSQDFEIVHAKAVAQIEADHKSREDTSPLPVSKDLHASDIHVLSSEGSLSGFSSENSEFESIGGSKVPDSLPSMEPSHSINDTRENPAKIEEILEPKSPEAVPELQGSSQEEPLQGSFVSQDPPEEETIIFNGGDTKWVDDSMQKESHHQNNVVSEDAAVKSSAKMNPWVQRCHSLLRETLPQGVWDLTCNHFQALLRDVDWKNLSKNTGIAVLSVFAFGLFVRNRKLAFELKRKHEEVARLMVALMNFQELWSANRSNAPVLRHASMVMHQ